MGACCSADVKFRPRGHPDNDDIEERDYDGETVENLTRVGEGGALIRLHGSSSSISMYTRQGKKGINQDSMTVWENFMGDKNTIFCGVFDGHGPSGHMVARHVRDHLPAKITSNFRRSNLNRYRLNPKVGIGENNGYGNIMNQKINEKEDRFYSSWEATLGKSFNELDGELAYDDSLDSFCSGTTAVTIIKQGDHLIMANLGDSRAVLCTRGGKNQLIPIQLTVDTKPSIPSEAERIRNCGGRVFAMEEEPNVMRVWMPEDDCPGLAMARAFGDFCLKDYGLISSPRVSYRKLTDEDEFVVLATDGVWDVLTNNDVIRIVAAVTNRGIAAKILVYYAIRAWRNRYPGSKVDDCAVICLFFKKRPILTKSVSDPTKDSVSQLGAGASQVANSKTGDGGDTVINCQIEADAKTVDELRRRTTARGVSRFRSLSRRRTSREFEMVAG